MSQILAASLFWCVFFVLADSRSKKDTQDVQFYNLISVHNFSDVLSAVHLTKQTTHFPVVECCVFQKGGSIGRPAGLTDKKPPPGVEHHERSVSCQSKDSYLKPAHTNSSIIDLSEKILLTTLEDKDDIAKQSLTFCSLEWLKLPPRKNRVRTQLVSGKEQKVACAGFAGSSIHLTTNMALETRYPLVSYDTTYVIMSAQTALGRLKLLKSGKKTLSKGAKISGVFNVYSAPFSFRAMGVRELLKLLKNKVKPQAPEMWGEDHWYLPIQETNISIHIHTYSTNGQ